MNVLKTMNAAVDGIQETDRTSQPSSSNNHADLNDASTRIRDVQSNGSSDKSRPKQIKAKAVPTLKSVPNPLLTNSKKTVVSSSKSVPSKTAPPKSLENNVTKAKEALIPNDTTEIEDEEVRLAMEMALAASKNPKLSAAEIQALVGERNKQAKLLEEYAQKKKEEQERKKREEIEMSQKRWEEKKELASNWWQATSMAVKETAAQLTEAAVKRAEEMKNNAEMRMYADEIKKDPKHIELRKKINATRKVYKAYRLQGNRVETRHLFKRQRMEKKLIQISDKLGKTQRLLTHSSYNVQEYLKAIMKASKKWRKQGTDEELMLEAQLCRNMHQMLALEKQKVKSKKTQREMKKYLQRCKGWLIDKKSFCEMNQMTLEATLNSMRALYEDMIAKQDELISRLKLSEEFANIDLSDVDISHIKLPLLPSARGAERSASLEAMKGLPLQDSIRLKKEASVKSGQRNQAPTYHDKLLTGRPELYVTASDDVSVNSVLSDPDEPFHEPPAITQKFVNKYASDEDSEVSRYNFGNDAPWMSSAASLRSGVSIKSTSSTDQIVKALALHEDAIEEEEDDVKVPAKPIAMKSAKEINHGITDEKKSSDSNTITDIEESRKIINDESKLV